MSKALLITIIIVLLSGLAFVVGNQATTSNSSSDSSASTTDNLNFKKEIFADSLGSPRDLEFSPEGILLASIPRQGKVVALPDKDNNLVADQTIDVISGLNNPHGLAFFNNKLFIAEETRLARYSWNPQTMKAALDKELFDIPSSGGHITRSVAFNTKGQMFVSIGSTCNVCEEDNPWYASVIVSDQDGNNPRVFSKGLRNATFIQRNPQTDEIWATEMGRDLLGDDIPPEEINILKDGGDFGWPYCYADKIRDSSVPVGHDICPQTVSPIFKMQAHSAPLGLAFIPSAHEEQDSLIYSPQYPEDWKGDLLVAFHGSWNRTVPTGYKVVRLNVEGNTITGQEDFLTGFTEQTVVKGRPVDLIFDKMGNLFISDDRAGVVYKVIKN